jgi:DNA repair protein RecN (Recombination protein N)
MLTCLQIENVAVIEKAEVHFDRGMNVLTGETGAGKSILIDSINAILGNRTSRDLIRTGAEKAVIRATFENVPESVMDKLANAGYERESDLLLMREITASGKNACRINGMPATAAVLKEICSGLVNIHGQHDSVGLINPATHMELLDEYAQNTSVFQAYYTVYRELIAVKREMDALITDETEKQRKIELLQYQVNEIDSADLTDGEEETLEARRKVLANAETIREKLAQAHALLSGDDENGGAVDLLGEAGNALSEAGALDENLHASADKLLEYYYAAKELATDLSGHLDDYEAGGGELNEIEDRLDSIYRLKKKYGETVADVLAFGEKARTELEAIQLSDQRRAELDAKKHALYEDARKKAEALTATRLAAFEELNGKIIKTLDFLNMPGVRLTLQHARGPLASHGQDTIEFYISTNPGEAPKPLAKIASGGELSRIMLAIKSAMADRDRIPTIIYDEIDTGVSGLAAGRIGETLKRNAQDHQILCVTHTAQIAAMADTHLLIQKSIENERTYTHIEPLDARGRIEALARLISGDHVTDLSRANATEMLENAAKTARA